MAMVCTQCHASHEQRLQCPDCGGRLHYREHRAPRTVSIRPTGTWMQSFGGRLLLGLLLAQGLYFGLRHFVTGFVLAAYGEEGAQALFHSWNGMILLESMQVVPLLLGCILAGAGQRQAFV